MKDKTFNESYDNICEDEEYCYDYGKDKDDCCKTPENSVKIKKEDVIDFDIPNYYIGKTHKYEARKVIEDFELSYNIGTAVTYLLRAKRKHKTPTDCIKKAMAHLKFELDKINNEKNK
jgi:hypothetical protein